MVMVKNKIPVLLQKRGVHDKVPLISSPIVPFINNRSLYEQKKNDVKSTAYLLRAMQKGKNTEGISRIR